MIFQNACATAFFCVFLFFIIPETRGQYHDGRCKCVCPNTTVVSNITSDKNLYISNVTPLLCECQHVVIPKVPPEVAEKAAEFCPLCQCQYDSRNTWTIKIVVILIIWIVAILFLYMLFLLCLDPLIISSKRGQDTQALTATDYQEQQNEDDESYGSVQLRLRAASSSGGNVLDRVGQQQDKWKRQVQEQRRNIYDKHNLLN